MTQPHFAGSLSTAADSKIALEESLSALEAAMGERSPHLCLAFASPHHAPLLQGLGPVLAQSTGAEVVLGCTGQSIVGGTREVEAEPALSLWAAHLPGTEVRPLEVTAVPGPDQTPSFSALPEVEDPARAGLLLFGEPFSFPMDAYLRSLNEERSGVPAVGGIASGGQRPGQILLLNENGLRQAGAVGAVIEGEIELCPVVSQGCRPVGQPWVITKCERNLVLELGGQPAAEVLVKTLEALPEGEREQFQKGPFLGLAIDATRSQFGRGDLLVRGILGMDPKRKALAVGDVLRRGQSVQFLMRDADSCAEDLRQLIGVHGDALEQDTGAQSGALLFTCNGRGRNMFPIPDHDVSCVRAGLRRDLPLAGFFANGEIGPVGGRNFLHGFTASVGLLKRRADAR